MTRVEYRADSVQDGMIQIRELTTGESKWEGDGVRPLFSLPVGMEELAGRITSMLNAYERRVHFQKHGGGLTVMSDSDTQQVGDEHASVLPLLQELAQKVGRHVIEWNAYADHIWALLTPPELLFVPTVEKIRGYGRESVKHSMFDTTTPAGQDSIYEEQLASLRALYGTAMANVRAYEAVLEEIQKRLDEEFGHLPKPPEDGPVRQGHKQDRNIYYHPEGGEIGGEFMAVVLDPRRAPLFKAALNEYFANHPEENC